MTSPTGDDNRSFVVTDEAHASPFSLLLGFSAVVPIAVGAILAWLQFPLGLVAETGAVLWGGAVLTFLSGVRRG